MRIDAHQHFWQLTKFDYAWMPPGENVLRRDYLPQELGSILQEHRFDGCVAVQATMDAGEAQWLLDLGKEYDFIKGAVVWADLTSARLPHDLDRLQRDAKFRGVRHPVHDEEDARWLLRDDVLTGLQELSRRNIPYDLLLRPIHLPLVPLVAERVPGLRMAIDHLAKPYIADHLVEGWAEDLAEAAKLPQVFCKLSGMITEASPQDWKAADLQPYIAHALSIFGAERCMFGSDWPVCRLAGSWKQVLAAFTQACGPLPQSVRDRVLGETAIRFYGLPSR